VNAQAAVVLGATFERDLEFSPQVLVVLVAHQEMKQAVSVGQYVEGFGRRGAGPIAGRDIAYSVPTGLTRGNPSRRQKPQQRGCVLELDVVDLRIFTSREMKKAAAEPVGCVSQTG